MDQLDAHRTVDAPEPAAASAGTVRHPCGRSGGGRPADRGRNVPVTSERPFDPGLQPERTLLAWQRTVLSLTAFVAVGVRLTAPDRGAVAVATGMVGLALAIAAYLGVSVRYRRAHAALTRSASLPPSGAWPLPALAGSTVMLGLLAVLYLAAGP
ncbi:DUF202 domain-containing protein [Cryobacterium sp. TMT4-10]|nr:DUF202 domain-containing protein [Cryobacterium sp. TMT4-10]